MNISRLRELLKPLPDSFDPAELASSLADELCGELEEFLELTKEARRASDEAELRALHIRVAELARKLGQPSPFQAPVRTAPRAEPIEGFTDADLGFDNDDDNVSASGFRAELAAVRQHGANKRHRH